jgi:hypothetical protein
LSKRQENASIGLKFSLSFYRDTALTEMKEWFLFKIQGLTLNKSCSLGWVEQLLF